MCGLKLGIEAVKKLEKKDSEALCERDVDKELQLLPCYLHLLFNLQAGVLPWITKEIEFAVFPVAVTKLGMRQREHYGLVSQGECRTVSTWVLKDKKYLLKTLPQIKHYEALE